MTNKDPAYLFYPSDFEMGTMGMSYEQKGKYISLLNLQHSKGGYLKERDLKRVLDFNNDDDIEVLEKFKFEDDKYFNKRLLDEIERRKSHSQKQRENAMKRWNKEKSISPQCNGNADAMPLETETRTKTINEDIIVIENKIPYKDITNYWNEKSNLAKIIKLSDTRKKTIKNRIEDFSEEDFYLMIDKVSASDFLQGKTTDWKATFDWCIKSANFIKIMEDNFKNKTDNRIREYNYGDVDEGKTFIDPKWLED